MGETTKAPHRTMDEQAEPEREIATGDEPAQGDENDETAADPADGEGSTSEPEQA